MSSLRVRDLSPFEDLSRGDEDWLTRLSEQVRESDHVLRLGAATEDPEPIVSRSYDGAWRAGRYIGSITLEGRRLEIEPRLAPAALRDLLHEALNVVIPMRSGALERTATIVPLLLALIWCRELDAATRHGLPFLRLPHRHEGLFVRGRVEEGRTRALRRRARLAIASTTSERSLGNEIARTIVCGHRALTRMLGGDSWMTPRAKDVMPHLWAAVGPRPRLPSAHAVRRIRYTPIRLPYRALVEHSWAVATGRGLRASGEGNAEGLLIDMAELWERFVLRCVTRAMQPGDKVIHEAMGKGPKQHLYRSMVSAAAMGRLLPDIVVRRGSRPIAIIDPKYKLIADRAEAPQGVTREDRYQLACYLSAYEHPDMVGMLAYPAEVHRDGRELPNERQQPSGAEAGSPWRGPGESTAWFRRISMEPERATRQLQETLLEGQDSLRSGTRPGFDARAA